MSARDPGTDWSRFRKCPVCHAAMGEPCEVLTGVPRDEPHTTRQTRTGMDDVIAELTAERFGTVMPPDRPT